VSGPQGAGSVLRTGGPRALGWLCAALLTVNVAVRTVLAATFPLFYKEAYFWQWSRHLRLGYLEHPPLVAWLIRASTSALGRSAFAIRLPALLLGTGSLVLAYWLAKLLFSERRVAALALLIVMALPMVNAVGVLMLPDSAAVCFHLLFLCLLVAAARRGSWWVWCGAGVAAGLMMLAKLTGVLPLAALAALGLLTTDGRRWLRRPEPYVVALIAAAVFSPYVLWNATHGWPTLRLHLWDRHVHQFGFSVWKVLEYAGEQLANTSMLVVPLIGVLFVRRGGLPPPWRGAFSMLVAQAGGVLGFFLLLGALTQTHPHWTVLAYVPAAVAVAAFAAARPAHWIVWRLPPLAALAAVGLAVVALPAVAAVPLARRLPLERCIGAKAAVHRQRILGWAGLSESLQRRIRRDFGGRVPTLFTDNYGCAAMLSFRTGQDVLNLEPLPREHLNEGDSPLYYMPWASLAGRNGLLVIGPQSAMHLPKCLPMLFDGFEELPPLDVEGCRYRLFSVQGFHPPAWLERSASHAKRDRS